jgi:hypothetical protein
MRTKRKIIILFLGIIMMLTMGISCDDDSSFSPDWAETSQINNNSSNASVENSPSQPASEETINTLDIIPPTRPLTSAPSFFDFPIPTASGTRVEKNDLAEIDYSNIEDGYVMVRWLRPTNLRLRVRVTGPTFEYIYDLNNSGDFEVFPLADGNGSYVVTVFEQIEGSRYSVALSANINVTLKDEFGPFLRPNQYVNFSPDSATVKKAAELVGGTTDFFDKIYAIYYFVINNIT